MNPYDPDPLWTPAAEQHRVVERGDYLVCIDCGALGQPEAEDRLRSVEADRIRAARLAGVALMGGSAAIVIVVVLLVWRWLV